ncbi:DedA family protein [Kineococcus sp. NBC_00420]|uniref:DedA family protein n=1 Tax=Kineococcus sp. NBC_00420 TaxID=2903564 RepID=UPI002E226757
MAALLAVPTVWLLVVVALLVFAEDALFVGFVVPGETAAIVAGASANLGHTPLPVAFAVVALAAVAGDSVGYLVGRRFGSRLLAAGPLRRHAVGLEKARDLLERRGGGAVFLGRFTAFLRAVTPALAGTARMPYGRFAAWNVVGGIVWAVAAVLVGYSAGASYSAAAQWLGRGSGVLVAVVAVVVLLVWSLRRRRHRTPTS